MNKNEEYTVDRFEGDFAVLIDSRGGREEIPRVLLSASEGDTVRYNGQDFEILPTDARRQQIKSKMNRLFKRR